MRKRTSKYNATKVKLPNGQTFASKHEYERYKELVSMQEVGIIFDLKCQIPFPLIPSQKVPKPYYQKNKNGSGRLVQTWQGVTYFADFSYINSDGELIVEDAKGMKTPIYNMKKKLVLEKYGIQIMEV